jgi:membrane protein DedA with SNARE-associated domain
MHTTVANLVASYGYWFVFLLITVESFGVPLPGETALVTAAAYAALSRLNIVLVIATAAAGAIVGDNAGYWVGREGGIALVKRYGRHVGLTDAKLARAHEFFARHGAKTVFIGRFIALLRSWAAALAGVSCMPYVTFTIFNALGGITWAIVFGSLGYAFGRNLPLLERYVGQLSIALVLLAALAVVVVLGARVFRRYREAIAAFIVATWKRTASSTRSRALRTRYPRAWTFLAARFARGEYLGLHLTIGFIISVAALWLFGGVTEDVLHHDPLTLVDLELASWFRGHSTPSLDHIAVALSLVGSPVAMAVLAVAGAVALAYRRSWIMLIAWLAALTGGGLLDAVLKRVIHRVRPVGAEAYLHGRSFSFPSGHAMGSLIGYGMLVYVLIAFWAPAARQRRAILDGALLLVLAIGLSRLYLGVHFLSDVIAGYAAGGLWLTACITGADIALRQRALTPWDIGIERRKVARTSPTTVVAENR